MTSNVKIVRRIHAELQRRHNKQAGAHDVLAIGLGWAMRGGRPDLARGQVLLYVVRRKMRKVPKHRRVPELIRHTIRASRGRSKRVVQFRTDVIEVPEIRNTGVITDTGTEHFTSGALVQWTDGGTQKWALLTVGHAVNGLTNNSVTVEPPGVPSVTGNVLVSTPENAPLDAALIQVPPTLADSLPDLPGGAPVCRVIDDLINDGQKLHPTGFSLRAGGAAVFTVYGWLPAQDSSAPLLSNAPNRNDLLLVQGRTDDFDPGTSGCVWLGGDAVPQVDAIHIGAFLPDYSRAMGQPMASYLAWANAQLGTVVTLVRVF